MSIALAIAIAWASLQLTSAVSQFVSVALPGRDEPFDSYYGFLYWHVGGHAFEFGLLIPPLIQLAIVLVVAALLHARFLAPTVDLVQDEEAGVAADEADADKPSSDGE